MNPITVALPDYLGQVKTDKYTTYFDTGIGFGAAEDDSGLICIKTFISYNEMKKSQLDEVRNLILGAIEFFNSDPKFRRTNYHKAVRNSHFRMFGTIIPKLEARLSEYR